MTKIVTVKRRGRKRTRSGGSCPSSRLTVEYERNADVKDAICARDTNYATNAENNVREINLRDGVGEVRDANYARSRELPTATW